MPDGWEYRHRLDPLNAADAWDDIDADGLNNREEYIHAANPRNPDHDGDGLADGLDPQPNSWDDADTDGDGDGYPLWQELFHGTSDAVPGDVAQILTNGSRTVTFTTSASPFSWGALRIGGHPIPLGWRQAFSLDLPGGTSIHLALTNAYHGSVSVTSANSLVLTGCSGGFVQGGTGDGTATLVLPVVTVLSDVPPGHCCHYHRAPCAIYTAICTPPLNGTWSCMVDGCGGQRKNRRRSATTYRVSMWALTRTGGHRPARHVSAGRPETASISCGTDIRGRGNQPDLRQH